MKKMRNKTYLCSVCFGFCNTLRHDICLECVSCVGKIQYTSYAVANAAAEWFFEEDDLSWLGAYKCSFCKQYHLGHSEIKLAS